MATIEQEFPAASYDLNNKLWDELPVTPDLDVRALVEAKKATGFRSRYSQKQFTVYELNRYGGIVGDVLVKHDPQPTRGAKISNAKLEFAKPDDPNLDYILNNIKEFKDINPADYHLVLLSIIAALEAAYSDLDTIELSSARTLEDPSGLKMAGAARELVDHGVDDVDGWVFRIIPPDEQNEAHYILKKVPPYKAVGSAALRTETGFTPAEDDEVLAA